MADLELVEKLRERAQVTYDEAKEALDACADDLLDAVIYLERKGKVPPPQGGGSFNSRESSQEENKYTAYTAPPKENSESFSNLVRRFFKWLGSLVRQSCVNMFEVWRKDKLMLSIPVIVLIILIVCGFWVSVPLLVVGIFMDCRYKFRGPESEQTNINNIIDEVANAADNLKNEMKNAQATRNKETKEDQQQ
jgi:hypothetical protein